MSRDEYQLHRHPRDVEHEARCAAAVAAYDKRIAREAAVNRLARLAICCIAAGLAVALFYSATA